MNSRIRETENLVVLKNARLREEIKCLRTKLSISTMYSIIMTITCLVLVFLLMYGNNELVENHQYEVNKMQEDFLIMQQNYEYLDNSYDSVVQTMVQLTEIAYDLDNQNKSLVQTNETYLSELEEFKLRDELFNKYEYALVNNNKRTDITYDQLVTLEELLEDSYIKDQDLILALVMTESSGNEKATNDTSTAKGYGQFLDGTSNFVYTKLMNEKNWNPNIAFDGTTNLEMMVEYIDYLYEKNNGDLYEIIKDYRGKEDITNYVAKIDSYLENVDKSVHEISLSY